MHVPRPSKETEDLFRTLVPEAPGVTVRPMFANLAAFVNGNMFAGLFGDAIGVRLPEEAVRARLLAVEGAGPYGPVRLTFDDGIVAQPCTGLEFAPTGGHPVLADRTIVEMKFRVDMPAVLKHLVETFKLEPSSVSKYRASIETLSREGLRAGSQHANLRLALNSGTMTSAAGEPGA